MDAFSAEIRKGTNMSTKISSDIEYENIIINIKLRFPEIEIDEENYEIPYVAIGSFNKFVIDQFKNNNKELIKKLFAYIEELYISKSGKVREFATIGILEGIQNMMGDNNLNTNEIERFLGIESKKWWIQLNKLWNKEIKYIGETINE